jgi:2-(1,2-epoxy-1,2-dihydrophenyl)acetyl-CoA isomerase
MPQYTAMLYEVRDGVATITLNRPDAANSLNHELSTEMLDAIIRSEEDPAVRAMVITATGRFFCAGADLRSFYTAAGDLKNRISILHVASRVSCARRFP